MDRETRDAIEYLERLEVQYAKTMDPKMRAALDRVMTVARDADHSEGFIILFLGYLTHRLHANPAMSGTQLPDFLMRTWAEFKEEMHKEVLPTASVN